LSKQPEIARQGERAVKAEPAQRTRHTERPAQSARPPQQQPRRENRRETADDGPDFRGFDQGNMPAFLTRTTRA
jgi:hypothetical protein